MSGREPPKRQASLFGDERALWFVDDRGECAIVVKEDDEPLRAGIDRLRVGQFAPVARLRRWGCEGGHFLRRVT